MRRLVLGICIVAAIAGAYILGQNSRQTETKKAAKRILYYVDPMHPAYKSDKPGTAPDCGMPLQAVFADDDAKTMSPASTLAESSPGTINIDGATQQLLGIKLATVERNGTSYQISAVGRVTPEDNRVYSINSGLDGFIRETYDDCVGCRVKKDQKLATYYSPDFIAAASGFLAASERVPGALGKEGGRSIQNYTDRLRNLGMSDVQIKQVAQSRQLPESIEVYAPVDGFILARNISAGQHFTHDMEFYRIGDLSQVWVSAEVGQQEASYLHPGTVAKLTLQSGRALQGRVTDSLPQSDPGSGTVKFRVAVDNGQYQLRPGMLVDVRFPVHLPAAVTVPTDALIDSGNQTRVYIETASGSFEPREVEIGWQSADRVEILKGIQPGQKVVVSATFLVDSESRLKATTPVAAAAGLKQNTRGTAPQHIASAKPASSSSSDGTSWR